ncbi:Eukaryotic translation initiation factor 2-alpha kinase 1 [Folsomia candida]|uniref:non-specific serine/threonine protein kinase n=1 Tax=Folsomia candida TaxID=158441 RepID=A0A226D9D8_FOLCA|nr:Eukaryotic translation initiation factor 2-alpha kinase 1 [Folsomia candida]
MAHTPVNVSSPVKIIGDFEVIPPTLGVGSFGKVWKVRNKTDKCDYALKEICITKVLANSDYNLTLLFEEVRVLQALNHPNIVRYHTSWVEGPDSEDIDKKWIIRNSGRYVVNMCGN